MFVFRGRDGEGSGYSLPLDSAHKWSVCWSCRAARQAALSCSISFIKRIKEQLTVASSFGTSSPTHSVIGAIMYVVCICLKEERRMDLIDVVLSLESESKLLEFMNCISSIRGFLKCSVFVLFRLCVLTRSHVLIVFVFLRNVT